MKTAAVLLLVAGELLLDANLSLATVISSASPTPQPLETHQNSHVKEGEVHVGELCLCSRGFQPPSFSQSPIQIVRDRVVISTPMQNELSGEIARSKKELARLNQRLSLNFTENIGIVYFHARQKKWNVKFTFGGLILNTSENIVVSTQQVFTLKECFSQTKSIKIKGQEYQTTQSMIQLGPILHSDD